MSTSIRPSSPRAWLLGIRPKTLPAAAAPILLGAAAAARAGGFPLPLFLACLVVGLALQIAANLANDYFDARSGVDAADRLGPRRVTQSGLLTPDQVRAGFLIALAIGATAGLYAVVRTGPVLLLVGAACLLGAVAYTAGPWPLARLGLGELAAFVFFGPVAGVGTFWVLRGQVTVPALVASLAPGLHAAALMGVNNLRDIVSDTRAGKQTLAVRFGEGFARWQCVILVALGNLVAWPLAIAWSDQRVLLALLLVPLAVPLQRGLLRAPLDAGMNRLLAATARWELITAVVLAALVLIP